MATKNFDNLALRTHTYLEPRETYQGAPIMEKTSNLVGTVLCCLCGTTMNMCPWNAEGHVANTAYVRHLLAGHAVLLMERGQ